jgi:hypothetical protein
MIIVKPINRLNKTLNIISFKNIYIKSLRS